VPYYFVAMPLLGVAFGAEVGTYLAIRHQHVGLHDLRGNSTNGWRAFGGKKEIKAPPGQVLLVTKSGQSVPIPEGDAADRGA